MENGKKIESKDGSSSITGLSLKEHGQRMLPEVLVMLGKVGGKYSRDEIVATLEGRFMQYSRFVERGGDRAQFLRELRKGKNAVQDKNLRKLYAIFAIVFGIIADEANNNLEGVASGFQALLRITMEAGPPYYRDHGFWGELSKMFPERLERVLSARRIRVFLRHPDYMDSFVSALNYANDEDTCLIVGETGSGKEEIARTTHYFSHRRNNIFHNVNVAGLSESLFNSEVSGILKRAATNVGTRLGAFLRVYREGNENSGQEMRKWGYYATKEDIKFKGKDEKVRISANEDDLKTVGGTLFLDEINSLDVGLQTVLLRIIENREVHVVGDDHLRKFNIKVVCAASTSIFDDMKEKRFRSDLYHRISTGVVRVPALREVKEAIPDFAEYQIAEMASKMGYAKGVEITERARKKLHGYEWPGNIRELHNVLYKALKKRKLEGGNEITADDIELFNSVDKVRGEKKGEVVDLRVMKYDELQQKYVRTILDACNGNVSKAARVAGLKNRSTFRTLMDKYNIGD